MKIVVVGLGYVGLANAVLLAQENEVIGVDTYYTKIELLKKSKSPFHDREMEIICRIKFEYLLYNKSW